MPRKLQQKIYQYTAVFDPAEEGGYTVSVPALPGCISEGDTFEEAQAMIKDAIEGYLMSLAKHSEPIPHESPVISQVTVTVPSRRSSRRPSLSR